MKTYRTLTLAAALAALAACSDSTGPSGNEGQLQFGYSGARNGSYSATGELVPSGSSAGFVKQSFAAAGSTTFSGDPVIILASYAPVTSQVGDQIELILPGRTGTFAFVEGCDANDCAEGFLGFSFDPDLGYDANGDYFTLVSGTVTITSVSGGRVRGTFSGTAVSDASGSARTLNVSGGSFDAPLGNGVGFDRLAATRARAQRAR